MFDSRLPDRLHGIIPNLWIERHQGNALGQGLGHKQAVARIVMNLRKTPVGNNVIERDRQKTVGVSLDAGEDTVYGRAGNRQFATPDLVQNLLDRTWLTRNSFAGSESSAFAIGESFAGE